MPKQVKVIPQDQGDVFNLVHRYADITHSKVKNGGSNSSPLEKAKPPEKKKDDEQPNYFV